jgi:hypothetical protein
MGTTYQTRTRASQTFYRVVIPILVALSLLASQLVPFAAPPALGAPDDPVFQNTEPFEIDGNTTVDTAGNIDWANAKGVVWRKDPTREDGTNPAACDNYALAMDGAEPAQPLRYDVIDPDGPTFEDDDGNELLSLTEAEYQSNCPGSDIIFTQGAKEDDQGTWSFKYATANPRKTDIERTFATGGLRDGTNPHLYFGFVILDSANEPSFHGNIEFNQADNGYQTWTTTNTNPATGVAGQVTLAKRTEGDLLVVVDYAPNNQSLKLYRWEQQGASFTWVDRTATVTTQRAVSATDANIPLTGIGGGTSGPRRFFEASVDLKALFDQEGCSSFAEAYAKSRNSGQSISSALTDVTTPLGVDIDFCGELSLRKVDDQVADPENADPEDLNGLAGAELLLRHDTDAAPGAVAYGPCTTDEDGYCTGADDEGRTLSGLEPGPYVAYEVAPPPGYKLSTPSFREIDLAPFGDEAVVFDNPPINYEVVVEGQDTNALGEPHTFTVTLTTDYIWDYDQDPDDNPVAQSDEVDIPLGGETLSLTWVGPDGTTIIDGANQAEAPFTCTTAGADDPDLEEGTCEIIVSGSTTPGAGTLTATYDPAVSGADSILSDSAVKLWRGLAATVAPDGVNVAGEPHTFTVTVAEVGPAFDDGGPDHSPSQTTPSENVTVTLAWDGPDDSTVTVGGVTIDPDDYDGFACDIDASKDEDSCEVVVTYGLAGPYTEVEDDDVFGSDLRIVEVEGSINGEPLTQHAAPGDNDLALPTTGQIGDEDISLSATKSWVRFLAQISPEDEINLVDWEHDFDISVFKLLSEEVDDGDYVHATDVGPGVEVELLWISDDGNSRITSVSGPDGETSIGAYDEDDDTQSATCITDATGDCTVRVEVVDTDQVASGTLSVVAIGNVVVDPNEAPRERIDNEGLEADGLTVDRIEANTGAKEWVRYDVEVTPDGLNPLGTDDEADADHVFTVEVSREGGGSLTRGGIEVDVAWVSPVGEITDVTGPSDDTTIGTYDPVTGTQTATCVTAGEDDLELAAGTCEVTVTSAEPGTGYLAVTEIRDGGVAVPDGDGTKIATVSFFDPATDECAAGDDEDACATKTWREYLLRIDPPVETNHTGDEHTYTVHVGYTDDGETSSPLVGATIATGDLSFSGAAVTVESNGCAAGTSAAGTCTIVVSNDGGPGQTTLTIDKVTVPDPDGAQDVTFTIVEFGLYADGDQYAEERDDAELEPNEALKFWIGYEIELEQPATNLVSESHTFTVTAYRVLGEDHTEVADGITLRLDFDDTDVPDAEYDAGDLVCTTDDDGQCTFVVGGPDTPGTGSLTVAAITADPSITFPDEEITDIGFRVLGDDEDPTEASLKTWIDYRVQVTPDTATNLARDDDGGLNDGRSEHTFTVSVERAESTGDEGPDWAPYLDGVSIDDDQLAWHRWDGTAWVEDEPDTWSSDCSGGLDWGYDTALFGILALLAPSSAFCSVTADSATPGTWRLSVTSITAPVDGDPEDIGARASATADSAALELDDATKTWVRYAASVDADGVNLAGDPHTFYVQVTRDAGQPGDPTATNGVTAFAAWDGDGDVVSINGVEVDEGDEIACVTSALTDRPDGIGLVPASDDGWCTFTVDSDAPGEGTLTVSSLQADDITDVIEVDGVATTAFDVEGDDASKTWIEVAAAISGHATNVVGDDHTFDIDIEVFDGGAGVTLDEVEVCYQWSGHEVDLPDCSLATVGDDLTASLQVLVPAPADDAVGTGALGVTSVTVEVSQYGLSWPFTLDPDSETGIITPLPIASNKTWVGYDVEIDGPATNLVDDTHVFTVTGRMLLPADVELSEVDADLADADISVSLLDELVGGFTDLPDDGTDCRDGSLDVDETGLAGTCEVAVVSADVGYTVVVAEIRGYAADSGETFARAVTDPAAGEDADFVADGPGVKTWIDYRLDASDDAVNAVGDAHEFVFTLTELRPDGDVTPSGATIDVELNRDHADGVGTFWDPVAGEPIDGDAASCTTGATGACSIWVNSTETGSTHLTASHEASVSGTERTFTLATGGGEAVKHWIDIEVTKSADVEEIPGGDKVVFIEGGQPSTVTYDFTVTNPSDRDLRVTSLRDVFFDRDDPANQIGEQDLLDAFVAANDDSDVLAAGSTVAFSFDHTLTADDLDNLFVDNTVTVEGEDLETGEPVSDDADETIVLVEVFAAVPGIDVIKSAVDGVEVDDDGPFVEVAPGETATVTYSYTVFNTGNEDLDTLTFDDDKIGDLTDEFVAAVEEAFGSAVLPSGERVTFEADYTLTAADIAAGSVTNLGVATGVGVDSGILVDADDPETVRIDELEPVGPAEVEVLAEVQERPLPRTGADALQLFLLGLLTVMLGLAVLLSTGRRRFE